MALPQSDEDCDTCRDSIIAEAEARFRTIFLSAPVGIVLAELETDAIVEANRAYCEIVGRNKNDILENGWKGLTHPDDLAEGTAMLTRLRRGTIDGYNLTKRYVKPDGEIVWAKIEVTRIQNYGDNSSPQYLVTVVDITERKTFEQQLEQKNTELERFTYTVSHELKSPLVTINGFLGLLEQDLQANDSGRISKDMQMISAAVRTMGQQLDNLLELSRIGRVVHPFENFSLTRLCEGVIERMTGVIDQYQAQVNIAPDMADVFADPIRIREVIQNLLENAMKFASQKNPPVVEVSASIVGERVLCRVRDNGPGVEPRYHERIFELFDRLDTQISGTGIGLSLVKRNIEIHEGKIWVESLGNGDGASFCFTLPYRKKP